MVLLEILPCRLVEGDILHLWFAHWCFEIDDYNEYTDLYQFSKLPTVFLPKNLIIVCFSSVNSQCHAEFVR